MKRYGVLVAAVQTSLEMLNGRGRLSLVGAPCGRRRRRGTIQALDAPADLSDRMRLDALRQCLPQGAASYASPARRTVDTARALGLDPILVPAFSEQDLGEWTGRRHDDLAVTAGDTYSRFWADPAGSKPPGGESVEDQITRTREGLRRIERASAILIVHSGTIRAALCIALDLAPQAALRFAIDPLSLTRIDRLATGWRVVLVNQMIA